MIKIFTGNYVYVEKSKFSRPDILKEYCSPKKYKKVKFVVTTEEDSICAVFDYKDILLKRQFMKNTIVGSKNVFDEARKYFQTIDNLFSGECVGILKEDGTLDYILEYLENTSFVEKERQSHFYSFTNSNITYEEKEMRHLLQRSTIFVFQQMEEYTVHIAKLLLGLGKKEKKICLYSLDKNTSKLFTPQEITQISGISSLEEKTNYIFVLSEKYCDTEYKDNEKRACYKSLEIMTKLYGNIITTNIKPDTNQQFVILEDEYWCNGLVDLMKHNILECIIQKEEGNIPIINIIKNNTYKELAGENIWSYFFKPFSAYTLDQAYASENYKIISRPLFIMSLGQNSEAKRLGISMNRINHVKEIQWKNEIIEYCKSELPQPFLSKRKILGVFCRGTDMNVVAGAILKNAQPEEVIEVTKKELESGDYDYIYLATEDERIYEKFLKQFEGIILASQMKRFNLGKDKEYERKWIADIPRENGAYEYGLDYLSVIYCLSLCDSLIASIRSGAYLAAMALNNNNYNHVIVVPNVVNKK